MTIVQTAWRAERQNCSARARRRFAPKHKKAKQQFGSLGDEAELVHNEDLRSAAGFPFQKKEVS